MIRKIIKRAAKMCGTAYIIIRLSVIASCAAACAALTAWIIYDSAGNVNALNAAKELMSMPPAFLLTGVLGSAIAEDYLGK